jgi:hypothetical protein
MHEWLKNQIASGLPAFAGSAVSGTLVIKQELINEMLADLLLNRTGGSPAANLGGELRAFTRFVKAVSVRAADGTLMIDFKIAV